MTSAPELIAREPAALLPELDRLVEMAWEPGWAPLALQQLISLCGTLRSLQAEQWPLLREMMRGHAIHRLMQEDPLVAYAGQPAISKPRYLDLVLGHPDAAAHRQGLSRAGRDLFGVTQTLPFFNALRSRTAYLATLIDAVAELQPGAEILTLRAGHLREAEAMTQAPGIRRWMILEPDAVARAVLNRGVPVGMPVQAMRGSLPYFSRRPFRHGCFDLVCLPRLSIGSPSEQQALIEAAFAVLKPGGRLLVCAFGRPVPEDAWIDTFLDVRIRWTRQQELAALLAVVPGTDCGSREMFTSPDGHMTYAILRRRG